MLFTELRFLPFLLLTFAVHWSLRSNRARKIWLLICSYAFYAGWDWRFLSLILLSTAVDSVAGKRIHASEDPTVRRRWLRFSLASNLGILGIFKYFDFFVESASSLLAFLGLPASMPTLEVLLPVGVSFYTFQTLSYSLDIYRRKLAPCKGVLDLALYVGFFPQLVAGPIVRAKDFLPQLRSSTSLSKVDLRACLALMFIGFFKKAVLSDNVSPVADDFFADPSNYSALGAWTGMAMFSIQLYCDFSGYSDLAIGTAGLLGYQLPQNFDFPYLATNVQAFWRRWHMTLSTWVHDYLYIPLGGSRGSKLFRYRNTLLSMTLIGLWHGAAWNFVFFGVYHGVMLVAYLEFRERWPAPSQSRPWLDVCSAIFTFLIVCISMTFFRSTDLTNLQQVLGALFVPGQGTAWHGLGPLAVFAAAGFAHLFWSRYPLEKMLQRPPDWAFAAACGVLIPVLWSLQNGAVQPFLYFQF